MTLVSLPRPIGIPGLAFTTGGTPTITTEVTLDAAGEYIAYVFSAKEAMTISHVGFRAGTAAGSPTIEVRIETVDTSTGLPSGTLWAANTNGTTGTVSSNTTVLQSLTASASVAAGQIFCVKIAYASGTSQQIQRINNYSTIFNPSVPYKVTNTGTPTKGTLGNTDGGMIAVGSSATAFYLLPGMVPINSYSGGTFNNTNSAKRGLRFTPAFNCRAIGIRWYEAASVGDCNIVIYDDAGTELSSSSTAFDGDIVSGSSVLHLYFDNPVTLAAGSTYRAVIEPSSATNVNVGTFTLASANYRSAFPGGATGHYTTFASAVWTDTATDTLPLLDVIIDQVDNGAGSGGGGGGQRVISG